MIIKGIFNRDNNDEEMNFERNKNQYKKNNPNLNISILNYSCSIIK